MSDVALSLLVIAMTGSFTALLFVFTAKRKAQKELDIREYCLRSGYHFSKNNAPLRREISIKGDSFLLTSTMVSGYNDTQTGSDSWDKVSIFRTDEADSDRPAFLIGSVSASPGWNSMPVMIRNAAAQALLAEGYEDFSPDMADALSTPSGRAFLVFQRDRGSDDAMIEQILPLLDRFPSESRILIHSGASGITIKCSNFYIRSLEDIKKLLDLGFACTVPAAV